MKVAAVMRLSATVAAVAADITITTVAAVVVTKTRTRRAHRALLVLVFLNGFAVEIPSAKLFQDQSLG